MSYIAIDKNNAKETTTNILVVEVQDTDELIDKNNVEYIKNINLLNVSLNGSYEPITDGEAAEVNDMLQYWGSIHMFGTEVIPSTSNSPQIKMTLKEYNKDLISQLDIMDALFGMGTYDEDSYTDEEIEELDNIFNNILGDK